MRLVAILWLNYIFCVGSYAAPSADYSQKKNVPRIQRSSSFSTWNSMLNDDNLFPYFEGVSKETDDELYYDEYENSYGSVGDFPPQSENIWADSSFPTFPDSDTLGGSRGGGKGNDYNDLLKAFFVLLKHMQSKEESTDARVSTSEQKESSDITIVGDQRTVTNEQEQSLPDEAASSATTIATSSTTVEPPKDHDSCDQVVGKDDSQCSSNSGNTEGTVPPLDSNDSERVTVGLSPTEKPADRTTSVTTVQLETIDATVASETAENKSESDADANPPTSTEKSESGSEANPSSTVGLSPTEKPVDYTTMATTVQIGTTGETSVAPLADIPSNDESTPPKPQEDSIPSDESSAPVGAAMESDATTPSSTTVGSETTEEKPESGADANPSTSPVQEGS